MTTTLPTSPLRHAVLALAVISLVTLQHAEADSAPNPRQVKIEPARNLTASMLAEAAAASKALPPQGDGRLLSHGVKPPEKPATAPLDIPGDVGSIGEVVVKPPPPPQVASFFSYQPRLARNFTGIGKDGTPADPIIAAGPTHLVAMINTQIAFFTKDGVNISETDLNAFFGLGSAFSFDPKVVFDERSQRFFVMMISRQDTPTRQSFFHFGVSQTSDPTQGWWIYNPQRNDLDGEWVDYPELGVGPGGLYLTGNYLNAPWPATSTNHTRTLWVVGKTALLSGGTALIWVFDDMAGPVDARGSLTPTIVYGTPPGSVDAFVTTWQIATPPGSPVVHVFYAVTLPPTFPAAAPTIIYRSVSQPFPGPMPNAPQLGGPASIQANNLGTPPMNALYQGGKVYTIFHWPGGGGIRLQPLECDVSAWPTLGACFGVFFDDPARFLFWPSIAVNHHGDGLIGASGSSTSEYVAARWTYRLKDESYFEPTRLLKSGEDYYGTSSDTTASVYRWGDYSGAAVDPLDHGFWIFNKYAKQRIGGQPVYGSWIGYVPRAVFVDRANAATETGSFSRPWNSVGEGVTDALAGNDLVIRTGTYPGAVTISKRLTVFADGGPVTIGQ